MSLTSDIKECALDLGFAKVGITSADPFTDHMQIMQERKDDYAFYFGAKRNFVDGMEPAKIMPTAKSIISLVYDYGKCDFPPSLMQHIGRIYLARCYMTPDSRINGSRPKLMGDFLRKKNIEVIQDRFLPERRLGARSGVTGFGRNNFAYARGGAGSFIVLYSILIDKELEYDTPNYTIACPKECNACQKACPTGAIEEPLRLNPAKCLAFNCWMTQEGRTPGVTDHIPMHIRPAMGVKVHGCDICQEVCPRNSKRLQEKFASDPLLEIIAEDFSLPKLLSCSDEFYQTRVQPIMYNYLSGRKYFQRNAAIALGNLGDPRHVPDLDEALHNPEALVRGYAAWGLGRIGGRQAKTALEKAGKTDNDPHVKEEIRAALGGL